LLAGISKVTVAITVESVNDLPVAEDVTAKTDEDNAVEIAVAAAETLAGQGRKIRVVSMPSTDTFDAQDAAYRDAVLPKSCTARVAVEAGVTAFWHKYVGLDGAVVGINRFGESAKGEELFEEFGFTADNVVKAVNGVL